MASTVGELFISLGIKGSEKTLGAVSKVGQGMNELKSSSLAAKASVLAVIYAVERMMSASAQTGTTLVNSSKLLDMNIVELQKYQYAARQAGASNEEMTGSFMALQNSMAQVQLNKSLPEGMKFIAQTIGGIDITKITNLPYMVERLQKFAQSAVPAGVKRWALGTTGVGQGIIAAMERGAFTPDMLAKAPTYSDKQAAQLDKVNIAMGNVRTKIEMAFGGFTSKHGMQMVKDVDLIAKAIMNLADALEKVAVKVSFFERLGHAIEGVANSLKLITEITDKINGKESKPGDLLYNAPNKDEHPELSQSMIPSYFETEVLPGLRAGWERMRGDLTGKPVSTPARPATPANSGPTNLTTVNQTITHVGDAKDTRAVGNLHKSAATAASKSAEKSHAYRNNPALLKGN